MEDLLGSVLGELILLPIDGGAKKWNGDLGTVPSRDGWCRVSGAQQIDVTQEAVA